MSYQKFLLATAAVFVSGCNQATPDNDLFNNYDAVTLETVDETVDWYEDEALIPETVSITVQDDRYGSSGFSVPGLPIWKTMEPAKNIAICATQLTGETFCFPDSRMERSRCPKTERCTYENVPTGEAPFAVSVFTINTMGRDIVDRGLAEVGGLADKFDHRTDAALLIKQARETNNKRASWRVTFILDDGTMTRRQQHDLAASARAAVISVASPGSADAETGALSGPMAVCWGDRYDGWVCDPLRDISLSVQEWTWE